MAHDEAMHRYEEQYDARKAKLQAVGFIGQGSVQTRRIACGSTPPAAAVTTRTPSIDGPYHYVDAEGPREKASACRSPKTNSAFTGSGSRTTVNCERLVEEMRRISSRVLALITGRQAP